MFKPMVQLDYASESKRRPVWVTRLAIVSIVLGCVGIPAGLLRVRSSASFLDPTFQPSYRSYPLVQPLYLSANGAAVLVSGYLAVAGIVSLVRPQAARPLHWAYVAIKAPLVIGTATLAVLCLAPAPTATANTLFIEGAMHILVFGIYPGFVAWILWSRNRPGEEHRKPGMPTE